MGEEKFHTASVIDGVIAHYKVTERDDTEFWRYRKHMSIRDSLAEKIGRFMSRGEVKPRTGDLFSKISSFAVLYGHGLVPTSYHSVADTMPEGELRLTLSKIRKATKDRVASLPSHRKFLDRCCARSAVPAA